MDTPQSGRSHAPIKSHRRSSGGSGRHNAMQVRPQGRQQVSESARHQPGTTPVESDVNRPGTPKMTVTVQYPARCRKPARRAPARAPVISVLLRLAAPLLRLLQPGSYAHRSRESPANTPGPPRKRRGRDSNPRRRKTPRNGFRDRRIQPLCHPSWGTAKARSSSGVRRSAEQDRDRASAAQPTALDRRGR